MTMHLHQLQTHLSASEALTVIELLDQLRDTLMAAYAAPIEQMLRDTQTDIDSAWEDDTF